MFGFKRYSLGKSRNILKWCYDWYKNHWQSLQKTELEQLESKMERLDQAVRSGEKKEAARLAKDLEKFGEGKIHRSFFHYTREIVFALAIALILATLVRQTWFELYQIPSGSMRPTYKEQDHLLVSKTTFGINMPLMTDHIYFDPDNVVRGNAVIWSGDNIDLPNTDTKYFWIFPYKKRYIKRLIGKPGDTLYFYGGRIYGIDQDGNDIAELRDNPAMENLDYIPFTTFEGKDVNTRPDNAGVSHQTVFLHFNKPVGRISTNLIGHSKAEVRTQSGWKEENSAGFDNKFGIKNFAMTRLLNRKQLELMHPDLAGKLQKTPLYLELKHSPSLAGSRMYGAAARNIYQTVLNTETSVIPLPEDKVDELMDSLYTARFEVRGGLAKNYSESPSAFDSFSPRLPDVEDGTYEFYHGKACRVSFKGCTQELSKDHPLYSRSPGNVQTLFNLGIVFNRVFSPLATERDYIPFRYSYFRNGDLFVMGSPIFKQNDPELQDFIKQEEQREKQNSGYTAFKDYGPPMQNGKIDADFIKKYGLHVPEKHYLVLGDNHAMSGDSRSFGFVPEENIKGTPTFIFWPPGSRWGFPDQASYPWITIQNTVVWIIFLIAIGIWYAIHRYRLKQPIYKKLS